jgi:Xaa-Pro aminopeptidase
MDTPKLLYANGKDSNALYAAGVYIPDPFYFLDFGDKKYIFLDDREVGVFLDHNKNKAIEVVNIGPYMERARELADAPPLFALGKLILDDYKTSRVQVPNNFPLALADYLRAQGVELQTLHPFYSARLQKEPHEVAHLKHVLGITSKAFETIERVLEESVFDDNNAIIYQGVPLTSEALKAKVDQVFLEHGASNDEGIIISCGPHAALPHHTGAGVLRPHQTIVCDIFPRHKATGYYADMTRTYVKGTPTEYVQRMYNAVLAAQREGIQKVRAGANSLAVHEAVEQVFLDKGFDVRTAGFVHGTGHGLGIDVHEMPFLNPNYNPVLLQTGNVVTVEPGLYYPEHGGVRIEDVVLVTDDGGEVLSQHPYRWVIP